MWNLKIRSVKGEKENIVEKGGNAGDQLFPQCLQNLSSWELLWFTCSHAYAKMHKKSNIIPFDTIQEANEKR